MMKNRVVQWPISEINLFLTKGNFMSYTLMEVVWKQVEHVKLKVRKNLERTLFPWLQRWDCVAGSPSPSHAGNWNPPGRSRNMYWGEGIRMGTTAGMTGLKPFVVKKLIWGMAMISLLLRPLYDFNGLH